MTLLFITIIAFNKGTLLRFIPDTDLPAGVWIESSFSTGITDTTGTPLAFARSFSMITGSESDTEAPVVTAISPADGSDAVGVTATLRVRFSESVNPLTVDKSTIVVNDDTGTLMPGSISFTDMDRLVTIMPQEPLVPEVLYTVTISGVTDKAGNEVVPRTSTFRTGLGFDLEGPQVVRAVPSGEGVPVNSIVVVEFNEAIDPATIDEATFYVYDYMTGQNIAGSRSVDSTGRVIYFTPAEPLSVGREYLITVTTGIQDIAGNVLNRWNGWFMTAFAPDTTLPEVVAVNPVDGQEGVPTNAMITVQMSEAVNPISVSAETVVLAEGGVVAAGTLSLEDGNRRIRFTPVLPLSPLTEYTLTVGGLRDVAGNVMAAPVVVSFTTEAGADLVNPVVVGISPPEETVDVPVNSRVVVLLSEPVSALTVGDTTVQLDGGIGPVGALLSLTDNNRLLTLTPTEDLSVSTLYTFRLEGIRDVSGNVMPLFTASFQTAAEATRDTASPFVTAFDPSNGSTDVVLTPVITVAFNELLNPVTVDTDTFWLAMEGFSGQIPATVSLDAGGTVVTLTPTVSLLPETVYRIRVSGVEDYAGNRRSTSSIFTTASGPGDTTPPEVVLVTPEDGMTDMPVNTSVVVTFSEPLDALTITNNTFALFADGEELSVSIQRSADNTVVTLDPWNPLPTGSWVTVVITDDVTDLAGNRLTDFYSEFTVEP